MTAALFAQNDRVWWWHTRTAVQRGVVRELDSDGRVAVLADDDTDLLYLDAAQLFQEIPAEDGIYSGIDDISYHADHTSLSSSGARALLAPSAPAIFDYERHTPPNPKPQYDFGHATHKLVLGEGSVIVEIDAPDWRGADAKAARLQAWAEHKVPLLSKDLATAKAMAAVVRAHPLARQLLDSPGQAELSGYWTDPQTGMRLRYRPDWLGEIRGQVYCVDYKTSTSADPTHFAKAAAEYGYHMQNAWYHDGLVATEVAINPEFRFIVQSKTPPHLVSVMRIRPHHVELGRRRNRQAIDTYHQCTVLGEWPGYGHHLQDIDLPSYAVYRQEEELSA